MVNDVQQLVNKLLKEYDPSSIRAAFLHVWMSQNPIDSKNLDTNSETQKMAGEIIDTELIATTISSSIPNLTIKQMEMVFETLIDGSRKKKQGAIYTPDHIIDFLIIDCFSNNHKSICKFLDPACGSGGFLIRWIHYAVTVLNCNIEDVIKHYVAGVDNDPVAVRHAKCLIEIYCASLGYRVNSQHINIICEDTLLCETSSLLHKIGWPTGVDLLLTNPPYVKLQTLDESYRDTLRTKYPEFTSFNYSLSILFVIAGHRLLSDTGALGFITQNNLFTSLTAEAVRRYLQDRKCVRKIIDFGHYRVFQHVLAYTCLIMIDKLSHNYIEYSRIEKETSVSELNSTKYERVEQHKLNPQKWRIVSQSDGSYIAKIENEGIPLSSVLSIKVGFATLKDKVFLVSKSSNGYCEAIHPLTKKRYQIESSMTTSAVRIADISSQETLEDVKRCIIFPYIKHEKNWYPIDEVTLLSKYPKAYEYLSDCRDLLSGRDKGKLRVKYWYEWGRTQGREASGPKLLTKTFSKTPQFFLDESNTLFCNGYGLFPTQRDLFSLDIPLNILRMILESKVMHYYMKQTSFQIDGNFQCYQKNFLEKFGFPELNADSINTLTELDIYEREQYISDLYGIPYSVIESI